MLNKTELQKFINELDKDFGITVDGLTISYSEDEEFLMSSPVGTNRQIIAGFSLITPFIIVAPATYIDSILTFSNCSKHPSAVVVGEEDCIYLQLYDSCIVQETGFCYVYIDYLQDPNNIIGNLIYDTLFVDFLIDKSNAELLYKKEVVETIPSKVVMNLKDPIPKLKYPLLEQLPVKTQQNNKLFKF